MERFEMVKKLMISSGHRKILKAFENIYQKGEEPENVFLILGGAVMLKDQNKNLDSCAKTDSFIGIQEALMNFNYIHTATTLTNSEIIVIPKLVFLAIVYGDPDIRGFFLKYMSRELPVYNSDFE
jgi:CRP-like cAMP-binding protein